MSDERQEFEWVKRTKATHAFHLSQLKTNPKWTLRDTAKELNRSLGRVSEDLMLASYMKTHPRVETYKSVQDAIAYCRKLKRQQKMSML